MCRGAHRQVADGRRDWPLSDRVPADGSSNSAGQAGLTVVRKGNTFTSYRSADGTTWQFMGSDVISMSATIYVGLAVCSHNTSALNTATFDHVSVIKG